MRTSPWGDGTQGWHGGGAKTPWDGGIMGRWHPRVTWRGYGDIVGCWDHGVVAPKGDMEGIWGHHHGVVAPKGGMEGTWGHRRVLGSWGDGIHGWYGGDIGTPRWSGGTQG